MEDWNVVVAVHEKGYLRAFAVLEEFGPVIRTEFFNVLVMRLQEPRLMMERLRVLFSEDSEIASILSRVVPVARIISYQNPEEFETKVREAVLTWKSALAGKKFYVRMHRRGFKGRISSMQTEQLLDRDLLNVLSAEGSPGQIDYEDPDAVVLIEMVGQTAGLALFSREDLGRYPFLRLD